MTMTADPTLREQLHPEALLARIRNLEEHVERLSQMVERLTENVEQHLRDT